MQFGEAGRLCSLSESCIYSRRCQGIKAPCHGSNTFVAGEGAQKTLCISCQSLPKFQAPQKAPTWQLISETSSLHLPPELNPCPS